MQRDKKIKLTVKTTSRELQPEALKQVTGGYIPIYQTNFCHGTRRYY